MIKEIILPDLGEGIESAEVSDVLVSVGSSVSKNDIIVVLESDKSSMEIPSDYTGKVTAVLVKSGEEVVKGQKLIIIEINDESKDLEKTKLKETTVELKKEQTIVSEQKKEYPKPGKKAFASPGIRRLARELEIDLGLLVGTGPKGRITKADLHEHIKKKMGSKKDSGQAQKKEIDFSLWGAIETQELTKINKITGERLQEAWQEIPHVTQYDFGDITELDKTRKDLKRKGAKKEIKVTFLPFIIKAVAIVLKEMPKFNSSLSQDGSSLILKKYYNIGVAVDTPWGLIVPVIKDVDKKDIFELSIELMDISERAKEKKLSLEELKGGTFTVSSLGGIGGSYFSPIVNPPEVGILGVSKSEWRPIYNKEKRDFEPRYVLPFSLSYDHRVIDGMSGVLFTRRLSEIFSTAGLFKD